MKITISLPKVVGEDLAADLEKQAVYASHLVRSLRVAADRKSVEVIGDDGAPEAEVRAKVERYLEAMVTRFRSIERKVLVQTQRKDKAPLETGVYEELKRRQWVFELGRGQCGFAGPALALHRALDDTFTRIGRERFAAVDQNYPTLIPSDILARCGYFTSFPHAVSMVVHLIEDYDLIEEFRQANAESALSGLKVPKPQVFGVPDPKYGEELSAWIVLKPGQSATEEEIRAFCKGQIAHYKIPRYVRFVDAFPMTVTGKIQKFRMREVSVEELGLERAAAIETA